MQASAEGLAPLPPSLPSWDYNLDVRVARTLTLDLDGIRADCGLTAGHPLAAVVTWRSTGTILRGCAIEHTLPGSGTVQIELEAVVPGSAVRGLLHVQTRVVLADAVPAAGALQPALAASVLWEDDAEVALEGVGSRFPMDLVAFADTGYAPPEAAWYFSWDPEDLHQPFMGAVRLLVNASHPRMAEMARKPSDPANAAVASMMYFDMGRTLLSGALRNDEYVAAPDQFPEGSVGATAYGLMRTFFPADTAQGLRSTMEQRPAEFDAQLQAALRLLRD
jgi:hypothetical protein